MILVELTPAVVEQLLQGVVQTGLQLANDDVTFAYPGRRRFPLFRQEQRRPRKAVVELADDCRRLVDSRGSAARTSDGAAISADLLAETEDALGGRDADYHPGHFLSLVRLSMDVTDTTTTGITAVERRSFHQLGRRLREMQTSERPLDPDLSSALLVTLSENDPSRMRGLADLLRYLDEVTLHPLLGWPQFAATDSLHLFLHLFDVASQARARRPESRATPLDACLGARAVLANSKMLHLRVGALLDLVLPSESERREELDQWLDGIERTGTDGTLPLSAKGRDATFRIEKADLQPTDLVMHTARKLRTSSRSHSVTDTLTALERTLYRKVYRQEGHKHHLVTLLRKSFERALQARHRKAMRVGSGTSRMPTPSQAPTEFERRWPLERWEPLKALGERLERARSGGWTPSGAVALDLLIAPGEERTETALPDAEEFLRWVLDCRGDLREALSRLSEEKRETLSNWLQRLFRRCANHDAARQALRDQQKRTYLPWSSTTPLQWFTAARELSRRGPEPRRWDPRVHDPDELLPPLDVRVEAALSDWQVRMPWEQRQFGIWPLSLRGETLRPGLRAGIAAAISHDENPVAVQVRLNLLERELEYRSWLGARERVRLFESTLVAID